MRFRVLAILLSLILCIATADAAKPKQQKQKKAERTSTVVKNEKANAEKKISQTNSKIRKNEEQVTRTLNDINLLDGQIADLNKRIAVFSAQADRINAEIVQVTDSIEILNKRLESLRSALTKSLRSTRRSRNNAGTTSFILSARSFNQAYRRVDALRQFAKWHERKSEEIGAVRERLDDKRLQLNTLQDEIRVTLHNLGRDQYELTDKQARSKKLVASLRSEQQTLRNVLKKQQQDVDNFSKELDAVIAREQAEALVKKKAQEEAARKKAQEEAAKKKAQEEAAKASGGQTAATDTQKKPAGQTANSGGAKPADNTAKTEKSAGTPPPPGSSFARHKGFLPYPVDAPHPIVKRFGHRKHQTADGVYTDNPGIDIQPAPGAQVRAVFDGEVTAVYYSLKMQYGVVVRHGDFITLYVGLTNPIVDKGVKVKAGQPLGTLFVNPSDNRSTLHFQICDCRGKSAVKLDPELWLK